MNDFGGHVVITNTKFDNFNTCGSLIRNKKVILSKPKGSISTYEEYFLYRSNKLLTELYTSDLSAPQIDPFSSTCSGLASPCFSITITGSTFKNFGKMKAALTEPFWVSPNKGLLYSGTIIDLDGFKGPIVLTGNTFTDNVLNYQNCDIG